MAGAGTSGVATLLIVDVPWADVWSGLFIPRFSSADNYWQTVVAIFGTTISPYLFFWQASQEVEDIHEIPRRQPLVNKPRQASAALERIRLDTAVGMAFSNIVAISIMITVAATLHAQGKTNIESSTQAAEALRPIAGPYAFALFATGIIGTDLLAIPVPSGSAAYAAGGAFRWRTGLTLKPKEGRAFLWDNRTRYDRRYDSQFHADRSYKSALLQRCDQRRGGLSRPGRNDGALPR